MVIYSSVRKVHRYPKSTSIHVPWRDYMINYYHPSRITAKVWQDIERAKASTRREVIN